MAKRSTLLRRVEKLRTSTPQRIQLLTGDPDRDAEIRAEAVELKAVGVSVLLLDAKAARV